MNVLPKENELQVKIGELLVKQFPYMTRRAGRRKAR